MCVKFGNPNVFAKGIDVVVVLLRLLMLLVLIVALRAIFFSICSISFLSSIIQQKFHKILTFFWGNCGTFLIKKSALNLSV